MSNKLLQRELKDARVGRIGALERELSLLSPLETQQEFERLSVMFRRAMACARKYDWSLSKCVLHGRMIEWELRELDLTDLDGDDGTLGLDYVVAVLREEKLKEHRQAVALMRCVTRRGCYEHKQQLVHTWGANAGVDVRAAEFDCAGRATTERERELEAALEAASRKLDKLEGVWENELSDSTRRLQELEGALRAANQKHSAELTMMLRDRQEMEEAIEGAALKRQELEDALAAGQIKFGELQEGCLKDRRLTEELRAELEATNIQVGVLEAASARRDRERLVLAGSEREKELEATLREANRVHHEREQQKAEQLREAAQREKALEAAYGEACSENIRCERGGAGEATARVDALDTIEDRWRDAQSEICALNKSKRRLQEELEAQKRESSILAEQYQAVVEANQRRADKESKPGLSTVDPSRLAGNPEMSAVIEGDKSLIEKRDKLQERLIQRKNRLEKPANN